MLSHFLMILQRLADESRQCEESLAQYESILFILNFSCNSANDGPPFEISVIKH
jgi:hypothetical protein